MSAIDSFVTMLASPTEVWEIALRDPTRGVRMLNIHYLRDDISAEMITDRLWRDHCCDILGLNFEEELVAAYIRLVKEFQQFSNRVEVVLLPRNTERIEYSPEAATRLAAVVERIEHETGLTLRDYQILPEITPDMYSDTTHLARDLGDVPFTEFLVDEYAESLGGSPEAAPEVHSGGQDSTAETSTTQQAHPRQSCRCSRARCATTSTNSRTSANDVSGRLLKATSADPLTPSAPKTPRRRESAKHAQRYWRLPPSGGSRLVRSYRTQRLLVARQRAPPPANR